MIKLNEDFVVIDHSIKHIKCQPFPVHVWSLDYFLDHIVDISEMTCSGCYVPMPIEVINKVKFIYANRPND